MPAMTWDEIEEAIRKGNALGQPKGMDVRPRPERCDGIHFILAQRINTLENQAAMLSSIVRIQDSQLNDLADEVKRLRKVVEPEDSGK